MRKRDNERHSIQDPFVKYATDIKDRKLFIH